jgi:hypothetical protein
MMRGDYLRVDPDAELKQLRAKVERLQELLRGIGANRYWEGRWRDEKTKDVERAKELYFANTEIEQLRTERDALFTINEGLRAALQQIVITDPPATSMDWFAEWKNLVFRLKGIARRALEEIAMSNPDPREPRVREAEETILDLHAKIERLTVLYAERWRVDNSGIEISHDELCTLSRLFNVRANLADPHHYRINEWLKQQIEARRASLRDRND